MRHPDVRPSCAARSPVSPRRGDRASAVLGVTAVELMPIHPIVDEPHLASDGLRNYWGYNPSHSSRSSRATRAGEAVPNSPMVRALHDAGIEVILDVVFNHTGEGDEFGPTLSFRGIDNASYYRPRSRRTRGSTSTTPAAATRSTSIPPASLDMVIDALRYWAARCGVDGFRFDLAATLGRGTAAFSTPHCGLLQAIAPGSGAVAAEADRRAMGRRARAVTGWASFPARWCEWNDRFRDTRAPFLARRRRQVAEFGSRLTGSSDMFAQPARSARQHQLHHRARRLHVA